MADVLTSLGKRIPAIPPRIHVLMAREAPVALVIRRGPTNRTAFMLWDRAKDEFTLGQWFRGRIYERRCDISPDGKLLIYFAGASWSPGTWTAVSRVPYLKALVFIPWDGTWNGGGLWTGNSAYSLNFFGEMPSATIDTEALQRDPLPLIANRMGECPMIYFPRLVRDGWMQISEERLATHESTTIFEKPIGHGWTLRKFATATMQERPGRGCYFDEHAIIGPEPAQQTHHALWEWADVDGDRVVYAAEGRIWGAAVGRTGLGEPEVLHDLRGMRYKRLVAPY